MLLTELKIKIYSQMKFSYPNNNNKIKELVRIRRMNCVYWCTGEHFLKK